MPFYNAVINTVNDYQIIILPKLQEVRSPKARRREEKRSLVGVNCCLFCFQISDFRQKSCRSKYLQQCSTNQCVCTHSFNAPQFAEGYKVPPEKTQSHLKSQVPPEMTLLKSQQNFQNRLKSNFLFTPISNIYFKRFSR